VTPPVRLRLSALISAVTMVALLTPACTLLPGGAASSPPPSATSAGRATAKPIQPLPSRTTLRVLTSNELTDINEVAVAAAAATNVKLEITYVGSSAGARTVASGKANGKYDAVWFDSNAYLALQPKAAGRIATSTRTMTSPVAFGLDAAVAKKLGWDKKAPTWAQIAKAAGEKRFRYGMSNPATSNPAFAALANVATALAGTGSVLRADQVNSVAGDMRRFFSAQSLTAESSAYLADRFVGIDGLPAAPQGLINYESKLIQLNESDRLDRPLTVVIPSDGVISANFPMSLLNAASPEARSAYAVLTDWLRSPDGQRVIMDTTARRPISGGVKVDPARFGDRQLIELPFPAQRAVLDRLLTSYLNSTRRVTQSIYVLDLSGSMTGEREEELREALISLAGGNSRVSSSGYAVFRAREKVTLIGYSSQVRKPQVITVPAGNPRQGLGRIRSVVGRLNAEAGNTATYTALREAYRVADRQIRNNPDALTSVVLMTDGEQNVGISEADFRRFYRGLRTEARAVPTFTVKFGPADADELDRIARLTGGKLFEVEDTKLVTAFRQIRAYQ
jgi:Ca-activated chloride channel homolog